MINLLNLYWLYRCYTQVFANREYEYSEYMESTFFQLDQSTIFHFMNNINFSCFYIASIYIRTFTLYGDEAPLSILKVNSSLSNRHYSDKIVVGKETRIQFDPDPNPGRILWMEQSHGNFSGQARYESFSVLGKVESGGGPIFKVVLEC